MDSEAVSQHVFHCVHTCIVIDFSGIPYLLKVMSWPLRAQVLSKHPVMCCNTK